MRKPLRVPIPRCCPTHRDWPSLARHLLADLSDVPNGAIIDALLQARRAGELFQLEDADAIDCAELIVRHRVLLATGQLRSRSSAVRITLPAAVARVA